MDNRDTSPTVELLTEMYRNVTMGSESLCAVVPRVTEKNLLTNITGQLEQYAGYTSRVEKELKKRCVKPKETNIMKKMMTRGGIAMNTIVDSSPGHIAEMIVRGTKMGADKLEKTMYELTACGCDSEATSLCREIIEFERREADKTGNFI